jgi:hypothetical protein
MVITAWSMINGESISSPCVAVRPYANKINRCLYVRTCSSPAFGLGTCFWPCSQLATRNYLLAAAAACGHLRRPRLASSSIFHIDALALGQGAPTSVAGSLAARHGQCGQAQKANAIRGGEQIFSLLCELANDNRPAGPPGSFLFSLSCSLGS